MRAARLRDGSRGRGSPWPSADETADLVDLPGGVPVAAPVEMASLMGEAEGEAQLLHAEVGAGEVRTSVARIGRLDQCLQHTGAASYG